MSTSLVEVLVVLAVSLGLLAGGLGLGSLGKKAAVQQGSKAVGVVQQLSREWSDW